MGRWRQTLRGTDTSGARCLPPRRSLQTNSGVAVLMNYLSFDVVSCGLVDATVISLVSTAAVAAALHRSNACRLRLQPLPRARMPVRAVHSMCVTYHLAQTAEQCVRTCAGRARWGDSVNINGIGSGNGL